MHPNQEPAVIAGQGTIALEVLEQVREMQSPALQGHSKKGDTKCQKPSPFLSAQAPHINAVVVPVGGGGMVAGIAVTIKVGNSSSRNLPVGRAGFSRQAAVLNFRKMLQ